ncbi:hypothetical protein CEXT_473581 [Caerostris extrusa]|uniref:Uncharacterized protein n=1 Tax=Caerostris extrusa TaxID=172846 RepID=A0AAV4TMX0_CAEEX|nr:hypothetical protein CEXT_473581 [Caerostris extrusa]
MRVDRILSLGCFIIFLTDEWKHFPNHSLTLTLTPKTVGISCRNTSTGSPDDFQPAGWSRNNRLQSEAGWREKAKTKRSVKIPCSRITVSKGARDSRISNAGREIYPRGAIDEQTTAQRAFLAVAVNFAIFNSLIAVCRALCTAESGALCFFLTTLRAKRFS